MQRANDAKSGKTRFPGTKPLKPNPDKKPELPGIKPPRDDWRPGGPGVTLRWPSDDGGQLPPRDGLPPPRVTLRYPSDDGLQLPPIDKFPPPRVTLRYPSDDGLQLPPIDKLPPISAQTMRWPSDDAGQLPPGDTKRV